SLSKPLRIIRVGSASVKRLSSVRSILTGRRERTTETAAAPAMIVSGLSHGERLRRYPRRLVEENRAVTNRKYDTSRDIQHPSR
ncbi:MAG: hypothetical protein MZV63_05865, partial [Marinilabiliales bacterium]|nr:hypothetical protein [Marinilabiliales bacterium]